MEANTCKFKETLFKAREDLRKEGDAPQYFIDFMNEAAAEEALPDKHYEELASHMDTVKKEFGLSDDEAVRFIALAQELTETVPCLTGFGTKERLPVVAYVAFLSEAAGAMIDRIRKDFNDEEKAAFMKMTRMYTTLSSHVAEVTAIGLVMQSVLSDFYDGRVCLKAITKAWDEFMGDARVMYDEDADEYRVLTPEERDDIFDDECDECPGCAEIRDDDCEGCEGCPYEDDDEAEPDDSCDGCSGCCSECVEDDDELHIVKPGEEFHMVIESDCENVDVEVIIRPKKGYVLPIEINGEILDGMAEDIMDAMYVSVMPDPFAEEAEEDKKGTDGKKSK